MVMIAEAASGHRIPADFFKKCSKLVVEQPKGVKAALERAWKDKETMHPDLHFRAAWLNAAVLDRLR